MDFIQRSIEMKWPLLLAELIFFFIGLLVFIIGIRIRKQSKSSAVIMIVLGVLLVILSLYLLFWTFIFGFNS